MRDVTVVIGAGGIGQAFTRRISSGRHALVANHPLDSADAAATLLANARFETTAMPADVSDRVMIQAIVSKAQGAWADHGAGAGSRRVAAHQSVGRG
jgi:NADP-dependent 3-hydroxy acid dehydrogenase YdfG